MSPDVTDVSRVLGFSGVTGVVTRALALSPSVDQRQQICFIALCFAQCSATQSSAAHHMPLSVAYRYR